MPRLATTDELGVETACVDGGEEIETRADAEATGGPPLIVAALGGVSDWALRYDGNHDAVPSAADEWTDGSLSGDFTDGCVGIEQGFWW